MRKLRLRLSNMFWVIQKTVNSGNLTQTCLMKIWKCLIIQLWIPLLSDSSKKSLSFKCIPNNIKKMLWWFKWDKNIKRLFGKWRQLLKKISFPVRQWLAATFLISFLILPSENFLWWRTKTDNQKWESSQHPTVNRTTYKHSNRIVYVVSIMQ